MPIFDGITYEKVCIAVERGEISTYISDSRYQSLYPGDKNSPITVEYRKMRAGVLQYLDEHPAKEMQCAEAFIDEIKTSPYAGSLITLIEMLREHTYAFDKKSFFTDELVMEMAKQVKIKTDMLEKILRRRTGLSIPS